MSDQRHIVVVEDDERISGILTDYLCNEGFCTTSFSDGGVALREVKKSMPDLIVLDVMIPGIDGIKFCRAIRQFSDVPIIIVSARIDEVDKLLGLDTGADDYMCKPISPRELMSRVHSLLRRVEGRVSQGKRPWIIDDQGFRIAWKEEWLRLTPLEFRMLRLLLSHPGRVFSRYQLLDSIHEEHRDITDRAVDTHIKNIRKKIQTIDSAQEHIISVYGVGYRFET